MMRLISRVLLVGAALSLGGCSGAMELFKSQDGATPAVERSELAQPDGTEAMAADLPPEKAVLATRTEVVAEPVAAEVAVAKPILPQDDVSLGKKYYRARDYGLAEKHFRAAAESQPRNAEAWLGLAAAYDELRRFDLADRAYAQALRIAGESIAIINNQGYSYILRGDYRRARERLMLASVKDPENPHVQANMALLAKRSGRPVAGQ